MEQGSFSDLYSVFLKATYNMKIGNREIEEGETIAIFDKIQASGLSEQMRVVSANGGFGNAAHVYWETPKDIQLTFSHGVFNKQQYALMLNSKMFMINDKNPREISYQEVLESDENGQFQLKYLPVKDLYVYNITGERIKTFKQNEKKITISTPYTDVVVNYVFEYREGGVHYTIGAPLTNGFLSLEGRTRVKDDETGQVVTGIIKIPKLKLLSNFSIRLGRQSNPVLGKLNAVGVPVRSESGTYVSEFYMLDNDIDSDI